MLNEIQSGDIPRLSSDRQVNRLLIDIVQRLKDYTDTQVKNLTELAEIGVALTATRNLDQLLEMIIDKARGFTNSDGGTLYLVSDDEQSLRFFIVQTESLNTFMGGIKGAPINWPTVPLTVDGEPNNKNVSAYAANSGQVVNIPDVYEVEGFDFAGTRNFDKNNGYRSKSMLVVPMRDHEGEIIGVLQLINATNLETGDVVAFDQRNQNLTKALASQAAVAITNARLIKELQELFEAFIKAIAEAIDQKSPYTGGHIKRVANLTMDIARKINEDTTGPYKDVVFNDDELTELRTAAWLHDTGKITTPEYVVDKQTKLETIFDRRELVRFRFETAIANARAQAGEAKADLYKSGVWSEADIANIENDLKEQVEQLMDDCQFIIDNNVTSEFVPDEKIDRLIKIGERTVLTTSGTEPMLTDNELYNLKIRKGNLTEEERKIIENHVVVTISMLNKLPFPKKMRRVPEYAGGHHEKMDGSGYPNGLTAEDLPLQARIMALADVFEALSAADRPYKKAKTLSEVIRILGFMTKDKHLDPEAVQFFLDNNMHMEYAHEHLAKDQIDI